MDTPRPIVGCYSEKCPRCGTDSPCVDHCEVDIGIGVQTWNHEFWCPTHGGFAYVDASDSGDEGLFTAPRKSMCIFRDDEGQ